MCDQLLYARQTSIFMSRQFKVVCINSKNIPADFPRQYWIEQDETYTVTMVSNMAKQPGVVGFQLAEVQIPTMCKYQHFVSSRFRPFTQDDADAFEAVKELLWEVEEENLVLR